MENEFPPDCIVIYVGKEIIDFIDSNSIIDDFYNPKNKKVQLE